MLFRLGQHGQSFLCAFEQAGRVRQAALLVGDLGPFARFDGQLLQFVNLPLEPFALVQHVGGVGFEFFQLFRHCAPGFIGGSDCTRVGAGLAVEQSALGLGLHQGLVGVLAMDVHQQVAQFAQLGGSGGHAVDVGLAAASVVDHPAQQRAALFHRELVRLQPLGGLGGGRKIGGDVGLGRAFAHHAGIAPAAQGQCQRIDQDRFAGPGFAGEDGKACGKFQFDRIDDNEITDGQGAEHGCLKVGVN